MKELARAKMSKTSQRDFLVAHRYTITDGMCALRGVLQTATAETEKCYSHFMFHAASTSTIFAIRKYLFLYLLDFLTVRKSI